MAAAETRAPDHDDRHHHIWHVHQVGSGILGGVLVTFGVLGFVDRLTLFSTEGGEVAGFPTNGLLSTISVVFGVVLIASAFAPRSTSSTVATVVGAAFVLAGFANLLVLETSANVLSFELPNVIFALLSGLALLVLGLYGRGSRALDEDNPYRLKAEAAAVARREAAVEREAARSVRVRQQAQRRAERRQRGRR